MTPAELLQKLWDFGVVLRVENGRLTIDAPAGVLTPDLKAEITAYRQALRTLLSHRFRVGGTYFVKRFVIDRSPPGLAAWADEAGYPRAGVVTVDGETVLASDIAMLVKNGRLEVIGLAPLGWRTPETSPPPTSDGSKPSRDPPLGPVWCSYERVGACARPKT